MRQAVRFMGTNVLRLTVLCVAAATAVADAATPRFTPPATPLVACDPYFSIWSTGRALNDNDTTHWTGKPHRLTALIEVDGTTYRLMGSAPRRAAAMPQSDQVVTPTQTIYTFAGAGVQVTLQFTTPSLPEDIDLLSRPITYLTFDVKSSDGKKHDAKLYFDASSELCVDVPRQEVEASKNAGNGLAVVKMGSVEQNVLQKVGDDLRIDWGYFYAAAPQDADPVVRVGEPRALRAAFSSENGRADADAVGPKEAGDVASSFEFDLGEVGDKSVRRWLVVAYDDLYSIQFMGKNLRPYWRRNGMEAEELLAEAARDYESLLERCDAFDRELMADLREAGGDNYVIVGSLAYRQCLAAGKFVADENGQPLQFCKENHSNGCIGTSDVFYPMAPQFFLFGPSMAKSFLVPFMEYAKSDRWKFPFAPHDLGTYPKANGQVYGGGERSEENQMPVEESGNMLLLMAGVAQVEGNAEFAEQYWPTLTQWAEYLKEKGFDPDNQLCTDDFAGHLAHNVNLSAKAICGLGAYAKLCEMKGEAEQAKEYRKVAEEFAARWVKEAADGDHYRLTFDRPGTWSQKYNLVWDRVLGLDLFPKEVFETEMKHYRSVQNRYGLPLDSRQEYTKLDWVLWTACLTGEDDDFDALVAPVVEFLRETPDRSPMTDWYRTDNARKVGFTARPVVGGVFMRLICDKDVWSKWADRDQTKASGYAALPIPPVVRELVPTSDTEAARWRYTQREPRGEWQSADYDDSGWKSGMSGFGAKGTPNAPIGSEWTSNDIWLRRTFDIENRNEGDLKLLMHHDEDAQVYINGVLAATVTGYTTNFNLMDLREEAVAALKPRGNTLAVHCKNRTGGQFIDVGLAEVEYPTAEEARVATKAGETK
ncbi:hypothetical protein Spa11_22830 [Botrimarina mediterranea]|uniref:Glutaminase A n=2 Tax=Botrimarina mediterranea TaxID=2528022 RepID=A0A518K8G9_9BACT|nr:hypothetical protein Spa11_22830 [Botrimarina mediterranea]